MDDEDHFEDFTTASEWEIFIANLERVLREWSGAIVEPETTNNGWLILNDSILFKDWPFKLTYFKKIKSKDMVESTLGVSTNESTYPAYLQPKDMQFPPTFSPHPLSEYFNLEEFGLLSSASVELSNESALKLLLSSALIALNNTSSGFPLFAQYHNPTQNYYNGVSESLGIRSSFNMVHLKHVNPQYHYLTGLLDIFKSKIGVSLQNPVSINAHIFYRTSSWPTHLVFDSFPPDLFEFLERSHPQSNNTWILPFGSKFDPFAALELVVGWTQLTENVVVDSANYSDLVPENAPDWFFSLKSQHPEFWLQEILSGFTALAGDRRTLEDILGKKLDGEFDLQYMSALNRLTQPELSVPGLNRVGRVLGKAQRGLLYSPSVYTDLPPLTKEQLDLLLLFLFPDAQSEPIHPYPPSFEGPLHFQKETIIALTESLSGIKSAPIGGILWRLALASGHLNTCVGSIPSLCHLWGEFVLELRYRWDKTILIPGLEGGSPNSSTCLLHQKLQMLNCCIDKKGARERGAEERAQGGGEQEESESEEDDEFFDAEDNELEGEEAVGGGAKPVGRLRKCGRLRLLKSLEPMYIPITQDCAPLTEDMLDEQARMLEELGEDEAGSELRAKMMSASLLSDMEAFKAANPGCSLEDFVRWYSPRDWIEFEESEGEEDVQSTSKDPKVPRGELSPRMKVSGNLWCEVWSSARSVPARRQNRLFDDTREAEKILGWLSTRSLSGIYELLFPCLVHGALLKILQEADELPITLKLPPNLVNGIVSLTRSIQPSIGCPREEEDGEVVSLRNSVLASLGRAERDITQIRSFLLKFPHLAPKLEELLIDNGRDLLPNYIRVDGVGGGPTGRVIREMFKGESRGSVVEGEGEEEERVDVYPKPFKRVFVLKSEPNPIGNPPSETEMGMGWLPQRMSCLLKSDEFLLAGTFSNRTDLT